MKSPNTYEHIFGPHVLYNLFHSAFALVMRIYSLLETIDPELSMHARKGNSIDLGVRALIRKYTSIENYELDA